MIKRIFKHYQLAWHMEEHDESFKPFGKEIELGHFGAGGLILNIIWLVIFGWGFAISHLVIGAIFCITVVGIPFGFQHFKFAKLGLIPFGARMQ